jgi:hypothetical protein
LALKRVSQSGELAAQPEHLRAEPWPLPRLPLPSTALTLTQTDLLRALLGWAPDALAEALLSTSLGPKTRVRFDEAAARVRASVSEGQPSP